MPAGQEGSRRQLVGWALDLLNDALRPFIEREMKANYRDNWIQEAKKSLRPNKPRERGVEFHWDTQTILAVLWNNWFNVFGKFLGREERSLVSDLQGVRNRWAHQKSFSVEDTHRSLDKIYLLLDAISASEALEIKRRRDELLLILAEQAKDRSDGDAEVRSDFPGKAPNPLGPPDVISGEYHQAKSSKDQPKGMYAPLYFYLQDLEEDEWRASFDEIERILGSELPFSARNYQAWWANERNPRSPQKLAWLKAGWYTTDLNLTGEKIVFRRERKSG